jgi:hypothetical protein
MSSATTDYASSPAPLPMSLITITNTATIAEHPKQSRVIIHCNLNWITEKKKKKKTE